MTYVDGFVLCVPNTEIETYAGLAKNAGKIWMEHGALSYVECVGEDLEDKGFCLTFLQMAKPKENETVVFAFITFKSREHRDEVNAKVHADPQLTAGCNPEDMPFDCKRMAYGGFKTLVEY